MTVFLCIRAIAAGEEALLPQMMNKLIAYCFDLEAMELMLMISLCVDEAFSQWS